MYTGNDTHLRWSTMICHFPRRQRRIGVIYFTRKTAYKLYESSTSVVWKLNLHELIWPGLSCYNLWQKRLQQYTHIDMYMYIHWKQMHAAGRRVIKTEEKWHSAKFHSKTQFNRIDFNLIYVITLAGSLYAGRLKYQRPKCSAGKTSNNNSHSA